MTIELQKKLALVQQTLSAARIEIDRLNAEINRLNEAKMIVLGRAKVVISTAHEEGSDFENEVLVIDGQGRKACIGEKCTEMMNIAMENSDPRLLVRLVIAHPDGASVLIDQLEKAADAVERSWEENK